MIAYLNLKNDGKNHEKKRNKIGKAAFLLFHLLLYVAEIFVLLLRINADTNKPLYPSLSASYILVSQQRNKKLRGFFVWGVYLKLKRWTFKVLN